VGNSAIEQLLSSGYCFSSGSTGCSVSIVFLCILSF
jgi:hypothetical protein